MNGDDVIADEGAMRPAWSRTGKALTWGGTIVVYLLVAVAIGMIAG